MWTLGINHTLHESSVCLINQDAIIFATAEERISRVKQDSRFPSGAIRAALEAGGIDGGQLGAIGLSWPRAHVALLHHLRVLVSGAVPRTRWWTVGPVKSFLDPGEGANDRKRISEVLGASAAERVHFFGHHLSHAWSAAAMSAGPRDAILVADGRGARNATSIWAQCDGRLKQLDGKSYPDSLGLLYSRITLYLGFEPLADEWKVMGLAAYGEPGISMDPFIRVGDDDYRVDARRLLGRGFFDLSSMEAILGPARRGDDPIEDRHRAIAYAAQEAVERAMLAMVRRAVRITGSRRLALAGGVAMNVKANGLILRSGLVEDLLVQPAASDEGSALGAAIACQVAAGGSCIPRPMVRADLGQATTDAAVEDALRTYRLAYRRVTDPADEAAACLARGDIIGWFQGRTEFGPRALGHRSILADPRDASVRDRVNQAVKFREWWRPFAPSVLEEHAGEWFIGCTSSPHMILSFPVTPDVANRIPAVVHVDGTARVHTVSRSIDPLYWSLIRRFADRTGVPVILNTSFNLKGDPIVNSVKDAVETFYTSGLDALIIGPFVVEKGSPCHDHALVTATGDVRK